MAAAPREGERALVWNDEFEGDRVDPSKWDFDIGNGFFDYQRHVWISGRGNEELQYDTREPVFAVAVGNEVTVDCTDHLVPELDFISLHTDPLWECKPIDEALAYAQLNVASVARVHPDTPIVITEAGWATASNGRGMHASHATPAAPAAYCVAPTTWARRCGMLTFLFEAFDEPWKGSSGPLEPEEHWGLFTVDRRPKPVVARLRASVDAATAA